MSGFQVLQQLKADPVTKDIPVVIVTSKPLAGEERVQLEAQATAILSKATTSPEVVLKEIESILT
jgi:putative two-component system response regulator